MDRYNLHVLTSGTRLGSYEVIAPLGKGGMGEVYRARDSVLGREVALKLLLEAVAADPERMARFEREAQLLAALNHPNIGVIHGLESHEGRRYLVLEYVPGESLDERLQRGPVPIDEACEIGRQTADALENAHERGIIHRDLKPANIRVTPEGRVKVLDFGLGKDIAAAAGDLSKSPTLATMETISGSLLGTAAYMSPEQARGKAVDRRADIWAFGCVLYELLTARKAFAGETISDLVAAVLKQEPDWDTLPAETPPYVRVLLRRCLEKDSRRRLRDIGDARVELEYPPTALIPVPAAVAVAARRGYPSWSIALAILLIGTVAGAIAWSLIRPTASRRGSMRFSTVTNFAGVEAEPSMSPDGRSVAFVSNRGGQFDIWVGLVNGGNLVRITSDPNLESRPRWSPDGTKIAYARLNDSGAWDIWMAPAFGGTARRLISGGADPAWSPDGRQLAYAAGNTIWIVDANGGTPRAITKADRSMHRQPVFSRDGRRLAFVGRSGGPYAHLAIVELETGDIRWLVTEQAQVLSPAWSPDDRSICFASSRGGSINVWRVGVDGGEFEQITAGQGDDAELDISGDGKRIVFASYRENIDLAEISIGAAGSPATGSAPKWIGSDAARNETAPVYSPDGRRLAYFTNRRGVDRETIWIANADGSNATPLIEDNCTNVFPRWLDSQTVNYFANCSPPAAALRRVSISGGIPETITTLPHMGPGHLASTGKVLMWNFQGQITLLAQGVKEPQPLNNIRGAWATWSPDGSRIGYVVSAARENDPQAGVWVYDLKNEPQQVFQGWAERFQWLSDTEIAFLEGKADLNGTLWLVKIGEPKASRELARIRVQRSYWMPALGTDFDVHPDRTRIVVQVTNLWEADLGMIEMIR